MKIKSEGKRAKLCDFGISRGLDDKTTNNQGTSRYMPPELKDSDISLGNDDLVKGDIWSIGMVMMEVVFDFYFYEKKKEINIQEVKKLKSDNFDKDIIHLVIEKLNLEDNDIKSIAMKCITVNPDERPSMERVYSEVKNLRKWVITNKV